MKVANMIIVSNATQYREQAGITGWTHQANSIIVF